MLYRIRLTTTEDLTIEADSWAEAQVRAGNLAYEANRHRHHGEETVAKVVMEEAPRT